MALIIMVAALTFQSLVHDYDSTIRSNTPTTVAVLALTTVVILTPKLASSSQRAQPQRLGSGDNYQVETPALSRPDGRPP